MITKPNRTEIKGTGGEIVLYRTKDGRTAVDVRLEKETVWLSQKNMSALFATERSVITKHLNNIFQSGELQRESNVQKMHIPGSDKPVAFYGLDAVLSVGYRVNSRRGTEFRIWATQILKDHILKGYTLNEQRLQAQVGRLKELRNAVDLMGRIISERSVTSTEADNALVALTLLIAESKPADKDTICKVIVNLINRENI